MSETTLIQEYYDWLDETKTELLNGVNEVITKNSTDKETLEIMRGLIKTMRIAPITPEG